MHIKWTDRNAARREGGGLLSSHGSHERVIILNRVRVVHTRSVAAEIAEVVVDAGKRGNGVEMVGRRATSPPKPIYIRGRRLNRSKTAGILDDIDADGVGTGEAVGSGAVEVGGWLWETGTKVGTLLLAEPLRCSKEHKSRRR